MFLCFVLLFCPPVVVHLDAPEAWQGLELMAIELKALLS